MVRLVANYPSADYSLSPACRSEKTVVDKKVKNVPWSKDQIRELFQFFDKNGDGKLSKEELKAAFRYLGSRCSTFRAMRALRCVDSNGDGFVSYEEFNDLVNYTLERGYKLN